jgi:hypothetical protein
LTFSIHFFTFFIGERASFWPFQAGFCGRRYYSHIFRPQGKFNKND